ncbi:rhodanese [Rhodococcus sp. 06-412-2C]|uniref:rhodanese-like domain-containing protein n=1 Tax=Nocardiaceae TaxID=85025 RepID=UPI0005622B26|nr:MULTISPECIES: rhodanese-like domain-containing protein [Rhodococcus]OZC90654.1 rhodanese [Rhodococcus sp. 06-412-2C]OZC98090.1 rhodanese [Rhodococcus sp. 06-412-2B]QII04921.1 rhodanese-like domain-containing protein [Rhodococcus fascians A25f]
MSSELISPSEAVAGEATLVDVRSAPSRIEFGTVAGAIVVDKDDVAVEFGADNRDRSERIVVFCGSVKGSGPVVEKLKELGYTNVAHVDGGFPALRDHGLPIQGV